MCMHTNHYINKNQEQHDCCCSNQLFFSKKKRLEILNNRLSWLQEKEADIKEAIEELEK